MIINFDSKEEALLSQVGGKGKALIETANVGFNVPAGLVLTADFFSGWLQEIQDSQAWSVFLEEQTRETCENLKDLARMRTLTPEQRNMLEAGVAALPGTSFAVRSSSPEEDLSETSFAGQYDTMLGVGAEGLEAAIASVYASMYDIRVVDYKKRNGLALENPRIAVILQEQIDSEVSGIAFSLNPNNNCYDEVMINASFGLGESVVSGRVTPDAYVVDKVKGKIVDKKVSDKASGLWLSPEGGTESRDNENPGETALSDSWIMAVADLAAKCEAHYGKPMDIEWTLNGEELYLLQTRPITSYIPLFEEMLTKPGERKNLYMDLVVMTQGFSESFSVMGFDIWKRLFSSMDEFSFPEGMDGITLFYHGRQYFHVPNLLKGLGKMGGAMIYNYDGSIRRAMDSIDLAEYMPDKKPPRVKKAMWDILKMSLSMMPMMIRAMLFDYRKVEAEYLEASVIVKDHFRQEPVLSKSMLELTDEFMGLFSGVVKRMGVALAGMNADRVLKKMFKGKGVDEYITAINMDSRSNPTSAMGKQMFELASSLEFQETQTGEEFASRIQEGKYSDVFLADYKKYMHNFGSRGFKEIDVATLRAYEDLAGFFERLKDINIGESHFLEIEKRKEQGFQELLKVAQKDGFEKKYRRQVEVCQALFGYREEKKYLIVMGVDQMRRAALAKGEMFVERGRLELREHIFDLNIGQISRAEEDASFDMEAARKENLEPYEQVSKVKHWPMLIDSRGRIFQELRKSEEGDLLGDPIARGVARGRARVMLSPDEKHLEPGDILVTVATEPSWTPVFANATAVVMEVGGALQHGAVIAREYGLPCVSGLPGVTSIIPDGAQIEVDGNNGIVRLLG